MGGHGAGAGISQQVNKYVGGRKQKKVVVGCPQQHFPLLARGPAYGFDALDAKWFDDGASHERNQRVKRLVRLKGGNPDSSINLRAVV